MNTLESFALELVSFFDTVKNLPYITLITLGIFLALSVTSLSTRLKNEERYRLWDVFAFSGQLLLFIAFFYSEQSLLDGNGFLPLSFALLMIGMIFALPPYIIFGEAYFIRIYGICYLFCFIIFNQTWWFALCLVLLYFYWDLQSEEEQQKIRKRLKFLRFWED
tara:strand:+ start:963 stop:1454 length:492 start_codon:yes stop_codon:yes gene_type:complete